MQTPDLTPEYRRAVEIFRDTLPEWKHYYSKHSINLPIVQGYKQFFISPIRKQSLSRSSRSWYWNQSNSQVQVTIFNRFELKICKYNTRKSSPGDLAPSYKLWSIAATVLDTTDRFYFVWCEKGPQNPIKSDDGEIVHTSHSATVATLGKEITLESLSFLSPFADPEVAHSFGWE